MLFSGIQTEMSSAEYLQLSFDAAIPAVTAAATRPAGDAAPITTPSKDGFIVYVLCRVSVEQLMRSFVGLP